MGVNKSCLGKQLVARRARHAEDTEEGFKLMSIQRMTCKDQPKSFYVHYSFVQVLL